MTESELSDSDLRKAVENMALEINSAHLDKCNITMTPKLWLLWETILEKANVSPSIGIDI